MFRTNLSLQETAVIRDRTSFSSRNDNSSNRKLKVQKFLHDYSAPFTFYAAVAWRISKCILIRHNTLFIYTFINFSADTDFVAQSLTRILLSEVDSKRTSADTFFASLLYRDRDFHDISSLFYSIQLTQHTRILERCFRAAFPALPCVQHYAGAQRVVIDDTHCTVTSSRWED